MTSLSPSARSILVTEELTLALDLGTVEGAEVVGGTFAVAPGVDNLEGSGVVGGFLRWGADEVKLTGGPNIAVVLA